MNATVPYVPGRYDKRVVQPEDCLRSVTKSGYPPVKAPDSPARHRHRLQRVKVAWDAAGLWTVIAVLAACLIADGAVLFLIAGWT